MRILVVGAGAVGGYFGGRLVQAGRDVTFLVRPRRAEQLNAKGLEILSPHGDITVHPKTVTPAQITSPYDVILLCVKSYALPAAIGDFATAVGPQSMILPTLNGMKHIDLLAARFGQAAVLGGVCLVSTEIDSEGRLRQLAGFQKLVYGELDGSTTSRLEALDASLRGAGFDTAVSRDILSDMWRKWVQLSSLGAANCLFRGSVGQIASVAGGSDLAILLIRECSGIAAACGYPPSKSFLKQQTALFLDRDSQLTSSMYRDLKGGAPVEADAILGDLLDRGRKHSVTAPLLQAAYVSLSIYQSSLAHTSAASR